MQPGPLAFPDILPDNATEGERRLFTLLKKTIPDDALIFYEPYIKVRRRKPGVVRPDIVILSPTMGLLLLEVKDWKPGTIVSGTTNTISIKTERGVKQETNPHRQAMNYTHKLVANLQQKKELLDENKNLKFSYQYGVVLTNITRADFRDRKLGNVLPEYQTLTKDDLHEHDHHLLLKRLKDMFEITKPHILTTRERDIIREVLYPEVPRVNEEKILAPHQELIAIEIEEGHRLLRGVPGSGKTLILAYRAYYLSRLNPDWRILITCFNISLASYIRNLLGHIADSQGQHGNIEVVHFHGQIARLFPVGRPRMTDGEAINKFIIDQLKMNNVPKGKYQAIFIDEGQDFQTPWVNLLLHLLDSRTGYMLIAEDNNQNIYRRDVNAWNEAGLNFRGRTIVLNYCYRNTGFYFALAKRTAYGSEKLSDNYHAMFEARKFYIPEVKEVEKGKGIVLAVEEMIERLIRRGFAYRDIGVIYVPDNPAGGNSIKKQVIVPLTVYLGNRIPCYWVSRCHLSKVSLDMSSDQVKITTIYSAKGLEFRAVILLGMENLDFIDKTRNPQGIAFTAITRGRDFVGVITGDSSARYVNALKETTQALLSLPKPKIDWGDMEPL